MGLWRTSIRRHDSKLPAVSHWCWALAITRASPPFLKTGRDRDEAPEADPPVIQHANIRRAAYYTAASSDPNESVWNL